MEEKSEDLVSQESKAQKDYVLRILTGPHKDAEVALGLEPLLLGKGESCDIVLMDNSLMNVHASFVCEEGNIFCEAQNEAQIFIEGKSISERTKLENFQPILCGKTLLSVGPADEVWPEITQGPVPLKQETSQDQEKPNEAPKATEEIRQIIKEKKLALGNTKVKIILGVLLFVLLLGGMSWFFSGSNKESQESPRQFPIVALKKEIESVLEKNNVNMKFVQINLSGSKFILQCYVEKSEDKQKIEKQLRAIPGIVFQSLRIYMQSNFIEQAQAILNGYVTLTAKPGAEIDTISLHGYLYAIDTLPAIKNRLFKDIAGLNNIETVLLSPDEVYDLASNLLTQYGLMGLLKIHTVKNGLMVTGNIQASDEPNWKDAQKALKNSLNGICKVLAYVAVVSQQAVKKLFFHSPITTVSIPENEIPWIDLKNGDRYFEGALLPSTYKIQSITQEGIRIQKNEDTIFFALTEL